MSKKQKQILIGALIPSALLAFFFTGPLWIIDSSITMSAPGAYQDSRARPLETTSRYQIRAFIMPGTIIIGASVKGQLCEVEVGAPRGRKTRGRLIRISNPQRSSKQVTVFGLYLGILPFARSHTIPTRNIRIPSRRHQANNEGQARELREIRAREDRLREAEHRRQRAPR